MKVRILSGNQKGAVLEMPRTEAESNIATGYAEAVPEDSPGPEPAGDPEDDEVERSRARRERVRAR